MRFLGATHTSTGPSCAVCIPTFRRPASLLASLASLLGHVDRFSRLMIGITGPYEESITKAVEEPINHLLQAFRLKKIDVQIRDQFEGLLPAKAWFRSDAERDILFLLDDDAAPGEGYFDLLDHFRDLKVAAVSGTLQTPINTAEYADWDDRQVLYRGPRSNPIVFTERSVEFPNKHQVFMHYPDEQFVYECDYLLGTALFIRTDLLELDFGFQKGVCAGEECDFTYRLYKLGYRLLFDPSRLAWHLHSNTGGMREFKDDMKIEETFGYFRQKWGPKA